MRINKVMRKYSNYFDDSNNDMEKWTIVEQMVAELSKSRTKNKTQFEKEIFKLCRKNLIARKISSYTKKQKIANAVYMYILRRPFYYIKRILKIDNTENEEFYTKPAYFWEYKQEKGWCGYWGTDIIERFSDYEKVLKYLDDEKSAKVLLYIIMARLTANWKYYSCCCDSGGNEYFDKSLIKLSDGQVIVDGGGYIGDTYLYFVKNFGKELLTRWYMYEPDKVNMQRAKDNLINETKVILRQVIIAEKSGKVNFKQSGTVGSSCSENGNEKIEAISLDEDIHEKVTFIKLDVEGSELLALQGAKKHIIEDKPVLAICVYHRKADIRTLIRFVVELNLNYKIYLRHYSNFHWDTIMYAIPD